MITGELRQRVDRLWEEFWTGGITNPLTVIEQISFLMFSRMLDIRENLNERKAKRFGDKAKVKMIFSPDQQHLRWGNFKRLQAPDMLKVVREDVFPHFKDIGRNGNGEKTTFSEYMADAQLMIQKPSLLVSAVNMIDALPIQDTDTKGDLYEYLLGKLTTAGINGQFRTPRHIIRTMVELVAPKPTDVVADPACGTGGFLVAALEYLYRAHTSKAGIIQKIDEDGRKYSIYTGDQLEPYRDHIQNCMFYGFDFDVTMLRIASMNLILHGLDNPNVHYCDSLSNAMPELFPKLASECFDVILANPPFKGSLDYSDVHSSLTAKVKTHKTELLFIALMLRMLKLGGRCAVIVPAGVLESSSSPHESLRRVLVEENQVEAIIALPHSTFKPYASVATAILVFGKGGRTDRVWAYEVSADGYSQDGKRTPVDDDDLPDLRRQWAMRMATSYRPKAGKHGWFTVDDIRESGYNLMPRIYLNHKPHSKRYTTVTLGDLCDIAKGLVGAAKSEPGPYPLVTTAAELGSHNEYHFDGEAVCIPLVSSTGHGHASMKRVYYMKGRFAAATIVAVLHPRDTSRLLPKYLYYFLQTFKDDILVPLMRGAANVSLNLGKLASLRIPLPSVTEQRAMIGTLDSAEDRIEELQREIHRVRGKRDEMLLMFRQTFLDEA